MKAIIVLFVLLTIVGVVLYGALSKKSRKKVMYMLRTCSKDMTSYGRFTWPESGPVACPDWDPKPCCGHGLHGLLLGCGDGTLLDWSEDAKWLVVEINPKDIVDLDGKIKVPRGTVVFCGGHIEAIAKLEALAPETLAMPVVGATRMAGDYGIAIAGDKGTAIAGDYGRATAGHCGTAIAGDKGRATAGDEGTATAGYRGNAMAGFEGKATAGDYGIATTKDEGEATAGFGGIATVGSWGIAIAGDCGTATAGLGGKARTGVNGSLSIRQSSSLNPHKKSIIKYKITKDGPIQPNILYQVDELASQLVPVEKEV